MQPVTLQLIRILRALLPVGHDGFEGLIAALLEALTGAHFYLAKSGSQQGRDMSSRAINSNVLAVECKRYGQDSELNERELLGELIQAARAIPDLDLWVLVTSRDIPSQLYESLNSLAAEEGIGFVALSSGDGYPSSLEILCANSPEIVTDHVAVKAIADSENVKNLLQSITKDANFEHQRARLREELSSPLAGYANWRTLNNQLFLQSVSTEQEARANYGQALNVEDGGSMLIPRAASWNALAEGLLTGDFSSALTALLGQDAPSLSANTISRLKEVWKGEYEQWSKHSLSGKQYVYIWALATSSTRRTHFRLPTRLRSVDQKPNAIRSRRVIRDRKDMHKVRARCETSILRVLQRAHLLLGY